VVYDGVFQGWHMLDGIVPEARRALERVGRFAQAMTRNDATSPRPDRIANVTRDGAPQSESMFPGTFTHFARAARTLRGSGRLSRCCGTPRAVHIGGRIALVAYAFDTPRVEVVRAHTLPTTNASTRVPAKCGFEHVDSVVDLDDGPVWRWERTREAHTTNGHAR